MNVCDIDTLATDRGISTDLQLATCVDLRVIAWTTGVSARVALS